MIIGLDHRVLTVRSLESSADFYGRVLGGDRLGEPGRPTAGRVGDQNLDLHAVGHTFDLKAAHPTPGAGDIVSLDGRFPRHGDRDPRGRRRAGELGPVPPTGARGPMISVHCRDPDGNLVEISSDHAAASYSSR